MKNKVLKIIFIFLFSAVFGIGLVSPFLYFADFSPTPLGDHINCASIDGANPSTDIPLDTVISNPEDYNNKKVYIDGEMAYYPKEKQYLLRDGLNYLPLDLSGCAMSEGWKRWSFSASVKGKFIFDNKGAKILADHVGENPPDTVVFYFFTSLFVFFITLAISIVKAIVVAARGRAAKKKMMKEKYE